MYALNTLLRHRNKQVFSSNFMTVNAEGTYLFLILVRLSSRSVTNENHTSKLHFCKICAFAEP